MESDDSISYAVSATTRPPRPDEVDKKSYYFYTKDQFENLRSQDAFLEYAEVHGNMYGTLKSEIDAKLSAGKDVLLDIDVQGSLRVKQMYPDAVLLFVLPPSLATLERRLRERGKDNEESIRIRLVNARTELRMADRYDFVIVNRVLDETIHSIRTILRSERHRTSRLTVKDALGSILMSSMSDA